MGILRRMRTAWACLVVLGVVSLAAGEPASLEIRVRPVEGKGTLAWGVLVEGREIATGEAPVASLAVQGTDPLRLMAALPTGVPATPADAEVWLNINTDGLVAYVPSAGDRWARVKLACTGDKCVADATTAEWQTFTVADPAQLITIHYARNDLEYTNLGLWTWDEKRKRTPQPNELRPVGRDDFGAVFQLDASTYGDPGDAIGMVPRRNLDWGMKDGGDRYWRPDMGKEIYVVQEDNRVYKERPDVSPKVQRVTLDADHNLSVRFSHKLPVAAFTPEKFRVSDSSGKDLHVKAVYPFKHEGDAAGMYSVQVEEKFEFPHKAYALTVEGYGTFNVEAGHIVKASPRFYDADAKLGANYTATATTFSVFAPGAIAAEVVIADAVEGVAGLKRTSMTPKDSGVWTATVQGDLAGKFYAYALRGIGFDPDEEITDIYARCTQGMHDRALIVDLRATDPKGFREHSFKPVGEPTDAIVYEMHVRDLSIASNSGIQHQGQYLGFAESGTTLPGDPAVKTGLDHIVELGVTHVQIMPVQDFLNDEMQGDHYNWGYMPMHFNSPDGWFASQPLGAGKITELKTAIQALHERGIGVILDVVYNHTAGEAPFEKLVPGYYFRLNDEGGFADGSGCGNEFASENPMARKFLLDSVKFWVEEYKIDGLRFDLMGLIDLETMKLVKSECRKINPGMLVYGEPWTGGRSPLNPITDHAHVRGTGLGAFNDHFRDAIKGDRDGGGPGFIQVGERVERVVKGLMGAIHDWSQDPTDSINYFEAHDNLTAWDKLVQSVPQASDADRNRMMRLGALALFTSQGLAFFHGGQEMCRSKKGSHNSYNQPDEVNQIDWILKKKNADVVEYHKGLIALRKAHPVFRLRTRAEVEKRVLFATPPDPRVIMYELDGTGLQGESASRILVYMNGAASPIKVSLPEGTWTIYANADKAGTTSLGTASGAVELQGNSGAMMMREQ